RVLLRTKYGQTGTVRIKAQSNGLLADSLSWQVSSVEDNNGLFVKASNQGLPSNLERGPGLDVPPLRVVRQSLAVAKIQAGSNQERAIESVDDNELSNWVNDGR